MKSRNILERDNVKSASEEELKRLEENRKVLVHFDNFLIGVMLSIPIIYVLCRWILDIIK